MPKFPFFKQLDQMDCGPSCLKSIAKYYGKDYNLQNLRDICGLNKEGVSLLGISEAAEKIGFRSLSVRITLEALKEMEMPCIIHWKQNHFVVLYKISQKKYYVSDPGKGLLTYSEADFSDSWLSTEINGELKGIALLMEPTPDFYSHHGDKQSGVSFGYLLGYLYPYKKLIVQLFIGLGVGSLLQLILPFLTQSLVDTGINTKNISFVYVVLIAQTMLFLGRLSVDFIRSWILLHITTRINISILTDFIIKLMKLPMGYFDSKMTGDLMQRMSDQGRIQSFLTGPTLNIIFTLFNLAIFTVVLAWYNLIIFAIFLISSILYSIWVILFLNRRRVLDFKYFEVSSKNQSAVIQLISGIQEIKLNNCEQQKRWAWERIQASLFKLNIQGMSLDQIQAAGAFFILEGKNILITFLVAKYVIDGDLTLGGMMAIQYIIGQLNSPIEQMLGFMHQFQDAKISLERLNEIHKIDDEEPVEKFLIQTLPKDKTIFMNDVSFTYPGAGNEPVLKNISLEIPEGKITAIVGMSGSGKTTILKLLLRFYEANKGAIKVGNTNFNQLGYRAWRSHCGTVMQDGFVFSDSIAKNIAVGDDIPDPQRLEYAIKVANIGDFIENLPLGIHTKIGQEGNGISQGQRQRMLIARAVYKEPEYIFFDEATNSLDANNESVIMDNLEVFLKGRTVVIVAHRLSTVKNADNIIVLEKGEIVEQGTHTQLVELKGEYFKLVKNQLELGN